MWINRSAKYPYVSRETWFTRYHLLGRKIARQSGTTTANDRRVAAVLAARPPRGCQQDEMVLNAIDNMEWVTHG